MEIEAKFQISDEDSISELLSIDQIGDYHLSECETIPIIDEYLDSKKRILLELGYYCRIRMMNTDGHPNKIEVTLKNLAQVKDDIHTRTEETVHLSDYTQSVQRWPESKARDLVEQMIKKEKLYRLFRIEQNRNRRYVSRKNISFADLSVDRVNVSIGSLQDAYTVLEIELMPERSFFELNTFLALIKNRYPLESLKGSKFERGISMLARGMKDEI